MGADVHVVGASTAGLYAAYCLARQGAKVHLYEAEPSLNPAPRTLILTPHFLRVLRFSPDDVLLNRVWQFELISANCTTSVTLKEPDLVVERQKLLALLLRKAQEAGVKIHYGYRLEDLEEERGKLVLRFRTEEGEEVVPSHILIGADGAKSLIADRLRRKHLPLVAVVQAKVHFQRAIPSERVRVWFDRNRTRFFLWLIPESPHRGVVGLIADEMEEAYRTLADFLSSHSWDPDGFQTALVPLYLPGTEMAVQLGARKVILVGDAAGHMKNTTVGGVVAGLRGASAVELAGDREVKVGREWRILKRELSLHAWLRRLLDCFSNEDYDRLLALLNHRTLRVLAAHPRDDFTKALVPLLLSQPQWFLFGAEILLKQLLGRKPQVGGGVYAGL